MHPLPGKSLLEIRGFDVVMFSGDRSTIFAVHKKTGISLRYLPAKEEFELFKDRVKTILGKEARE